MFDKLEEIFKEMNIDYFRQGTYGDDAYPDRFFTFWNADTPEGGFYDNEAHKCYYVWYVYFYTNKANEIYSVFDEFINKAKNKGFIANGRGNDAPVDDKNFYGRYVVLTFIENYNIINDKEN